MFQRTPPIINTPVINLCTQINKESKPIFLDVEAKPHSVELDCYANVSQQIAQEEGRVQYGWQLWEWPGVMIEAEFHAIWVDKDGKLHDITPKTNKRITKILFLPDDSRTYEGRQIDNVRIPLQEDPLIHEFIDNAHRYFEAMNRGELASFHGYVELTPEMKALAIRHKQLIGILAQKYPIQNFL